MCPMEEGLISCQLAFYPLATDEYLRDINLIVNLIETSGLDCEVGPMSSYIKGAAEDIFKLLEAIHLVSSQRGIEYSMSLLMSNTCGK